jgi:outer membrane lipoprotein-sorting protein
MRRLALLPARRLWAIAFAIVVVAAGGVGIAQAALGGGTRPAPKPLPTAVHDALTARPVEGITARIEFTNNLLPSGTAVRGAGGTPLLTGATGRLWLARDGRARLELQSDNGDVQVLVHGNDVSVYDATSNTVYKATLPASKQNGHQTDAPPTVAAIQRALGRVGEAWNVSGAQPTSTAGQPSYTVRISPKDDGGLLGAAELAWDAARGVPLRAAVYAQGDSKPVLELKATGISYGSVPASDLNVAPPAGAKVVQLNPQGAAIHDHGGQVKAVTGVAAVSKQLNFPLAAPQQLAGLPRKGVRLVSIQGADGALITYGRGLGAIVVFERKADGSSAQAVPTGRFELPSVNIDGATGKELPTALGTLVTFDRAGVSYTVLGSVPPVAAENAARGLR